MTASDQSTNYDKVLCANLQRVIDFLKYAEAKNGALLTFSSAWSLAIVGLFVSGKYALPQSGWVIALLLIGFGASAILSLASFFPKTNLPKFLGGKRAGPHAPNLLYFGDICSLTAADLKAAIATHYYPSREGQYPQKYFDDLIVQISVNSTIASYKLRMFRLGLLSASISVLVALLGLVVLVIS